MSRNISQSVILMLIATIAIASLIGMSLGAVAISAPSQQRYALAGEARALDVALGENGVTLGLALSEADSSPKASGIGAGRCALLGDNSIPEDLPCSGETTVDSHYPGKPGANAPSCTTSSLPAPLGDVLSLKVACGSSNSGLDKGAPWTKNNGKVAGLSASLPVGALAPGGQAATSLVDDLTSLLAPVLGEPPKVVRESVEDVLALIGEVDATNALRVELGPSESNITPDGKIHTVESSAAGALIGVLGIPEVNASGGAVAGTANPLENGLVIIEVGTARASATIDRTSAIAESAASPALVTIKVRDITKTEPTYVEVSISPGQSVTLLEGTPAESTITASAASTEDSGHNARAAADAVRLHLLKGIQGGVRLSLGRATASAQVDDEVLGGPAPPRGQVGQPPDRGVLPVTGGRDLSGPATVVLVTAALLLAALLGPRLWLLARRRQAR